MSSSVSVVIIIIIIIIIIIRQFIKHCNMSMESLQAAPASELEAKGGQDKF